MRAILALPFVYDAFQRLAGAKHGRSVLVNQYIRPRSGERFLDIGCGTAEILEHLPGVEYVGFDESQEYIAAARARFADRAEFVCGRVEAVDVQRFGDFDAVLAIGVLHHLADRAAIRLFELARSILRPGGRLISIDGCYVPHQSQIARFLLSRDRGRFVRDETGYLSLARAVFPVVRGDVRHDLARFPYTHLVMSCSTE